MKLGEYMEEKGLTLKEFSVKLGISENHLYSLVKGRRNPSLPIAQKVHNLTFGKVSILDWGRDGRNDATNRDSREVIDSNPSF